MPKLGWESSEERKEGKVSKGGGRRKSEEGREGNVIREELLAQSKRISTTDRVCLVKELDLRACARGNLPSRGVRLTRICSLESEPSFPRHLIFLLLDCRSRREEKGKDRMRRLVGLSH